MALEHVVTKSVNVGGRTISSRISFTGGGLVSIDESIPGPSTNLEVDLVVDISQIQSVIIKADKAMTLYFNEASTGSPSKTLALVAGQAFQWDNLSGATNPWGSTDITKVFVTKAGSGAARLQMEFLVDATG